MISTRAVDDTEMQSTARLRCGDDVVDDDDNGGGGGGGGECGHGERCYASSSANGMALIADLRVDE